MPVVAPLSRHAQRTKASSDTLWRHGVTQHMLGTVSEVDAALCSCFPCCSNACCKWVPTGLIQSDRLHLASMTSQERVVTIREMLNLPNVANLNHIKYHGIECCQRAICVMLKISPHTLYELQGITQQYVYILSPSFLIF